jgi:hypothetical protein
MRSKYFLGGLFLGLATAFTLAQEITGDIRGIVRDPSGAVVHRTPKDSPVISLA